MPENELCKLIMDHVKAVHSEYGPGLLESVYEKLLLDRLLKAGLRARRQVPVFLDLENLSNERGYYIDILVEDKVLIELKSVAELANIQNLCSRIVSKES